MLLNDQRLEIRQMWWIDRIHQFPRTVVRQQPYRNIRISPNSSPIFYCYPVFLYLNNWTSYYILHTSDELFIARTGKYAQFRFVCIHV